MRNVIAMSSIVMVMLLTSTTLVAASRSESTPSNLAYQQIGTRSHPNLAFTQGLIIDQQAFVESSGLYKQSFIQRYPIKEGSNAPSLTKLLSKSDFAEGLASIGTHLWLITWQQGIARKFTSDTLKQVEIARYRGEGWGLSFDGKHLIMSDGSAKLQFRTPDDFALQRSLEVTLNNQPLNALNELEVARGFIWANVWFDPRIYAIHPGTGQVVAMIDLSTIIEQEKKLHSFGLQRDSVANGIAYDAEADALWVTGKRWRKLYLIRPIEWPRP
ncbi:glutaminyl-peptide cyclotransferase [Simiduia curdlanivorans]|uniref:Glutaminyl-peptide cyclotransferase n=1 Tax=Simiduia curdlanivorans TaxID=1492769 RepID=A0ABV8V2N4_9GAMM|nr:glutaminyl-peptide cyclotransferase [Simiduia curdlanivorans]MDN3640195.1 glutaminyl-peptide cyclotransferase [Simiduia curdlanivorans]